MNPAVHFIQLLFSIYTFMLFVRILGSWIPETNGYKIFRLIAFYTDPYLNLFRQIIPPLGMIDISPIVAFLCLGFLENILVKLLAVFF